MISAYRDALVRSGREEVQLGEDLSIGFHFFLADTKEKAIKEAAKYYEENLKMFGPLRLVQSLSDEDIEIMGDPKRAPNAGLPTIDRAVERQGFLCGPPELIIQQLKALEEEYPGLDRVGMSHPVGTPERVILEQLEWLAKEVMPAFTGRVEAAVPAD